MTGNRLVQPGRRVWVKGHVISIDGVSKRESGFWAEVLAPAVSAHEGEWWTARVEGRGIVRTIRADWCRVQRESEERREARKVIQGAVNRAAAAAGRR